MRFNVDQLRDALKLLKPVTRSNRHYEPWKRVLVSYDGNYETTISATNGDVWMVTHISADAESEPITLFLDLVELEEAIKHMNFNVYLTKSETDDEVVLVSDSVGTRSTQITNYNADDFAPVPDAKPDDTSGLLFQLTQKNWIALRERVMPYADAGRLPSRARVCPLREPVRERDGYRSGWLPSRERPPHGCGAGVRSVPASRAPPQDAAHQACACQRLWDGRRERVRPARVQSPADQEEPHAVRLDGDPQARRHVPGLSTDHPETGDAERELHGSGVADRGSRQGEGWERVPAQSRDAPSFH